MKVRRIDVFFCEESKFFFEIAISFLVFEKNAKNRVKVKDFFPAQMRQKPSNRKSKIFRLFQESMKSIVVSPDVFFCEESKSFFEILISSQVFEKNAKNQVKVKDFFPAQMKQSPSNRKSKIFRAFSRTLEVESSFPRRIFL